MPNWIKGTFRARGEKENIKRFIMEGLTPVDLGGNEQNISREIDDEDDYFHITFKLESENTKDKYPDYLHIAGTRRQFLEYLCLGEINVYKNKNGDYQFAQSFKGAWGIDTDHIEEIAKKYEIDIRVNGFECGMEFEQLFEVSRNGQIKCNSVISYDDYTWQCSMPLLGG